MNHLLEVLELVQPSDWVSGMAWYRLANEHARRICAVADVTLRQASACIAVLSPRIPWPETAMVAYQAALHHSLGGCFDDFSLHCRVTKVNQAKAFAILAGDLSALHGPKVEAFAENIQYPDSSRRVTIDSWAYRCWAGLLGVTDEFKARLQGKLYETVEADYVSLADELGLLPLQLQAILWVTAHRVENKPL